jgi:hypothetical protein
MSAFRRLLRPTAAGDIIWTWPSGNQFEMHFAIRWNHNDPAVLLEYQMGDGEEIRISVGFEMTPTQFDGQRWWFTCPLIVNGTKCWRRAEKLYLPPGAKYFGCRKCHDLSYRSCQEAHSMERSFGRLGYPAPLAREMAAVLEQDRLRRIRESRRP